MSHTMATPQWAAKEVARAFVDRCAAQGHATVLADKAPAGAERPSVEATIAGQADIETWRWQLAHLGKMLADAVIERGWDVLAPQDPPDDDEAAQAMSKERGVAVRTGWRPVEGGTRVRFDVLAGYRVPVKEPAR